VPAIHVLIAGRVQGVGFRWFARVSARRLGLNGWVRNRPDGTVEIAAEGPQEKLDQFLREMRRGPDAAHVETVGELDAIAEALEFPFAVRR
jgi:acylphosphatase